MCSSLAVVDSLVFVDVVLLFVVLSMFLPCLPCFHLIGVVGAVYVSGDQSSMFQWIQGSEGCSSWCNHGYCFSHSVFLGVALQYREYPEYCLLVVASAEVTVLGLL